MTQYISNRLKQVQPSQTMAITQRARALKASGRDIISLSVGEPDFDTPDYICKAAIDAMAKGQTRYTNVDGIPELKSAIAAKFRRDNALDYKEEQISVAPGGKAIIFNAFMATLNPGDEVIIPTPCWVSYPDMVRLAGGAPVLALCPQSAGFKLTPEQLEAAISPRTRWLLLNSPSNPTGAAYSATELKALANVLERHPQILILCDDIYEHLIYDGQRFATLAEIAPSLFERVLTMNGVSKCYAMTGWRIGYAGGPKWLIRSMAKIMSQSTSNPCSISQRAALAALTGDQTFLKVWQHKFQDRRDLVVAHIDAMQSLSCLSPHGAFYVFINCQELLETFRTNPKNMQYKHIANITTDTQLAAIILEQAGIALVPGTAFQAPGHLRLSFATDMNTLSLACERLSNFIDDFHPMPPSQI